MKFIGLIIVGLVLSTSDGLAAKEYAPDLSANRQAITVEIVKWVGEIGDEASDHTTEHSHRLKFINQETGKSYDIVDSPELVRLHHDTEKNYLVEIEAEITPKFLLWGGNLIAKSFKVLEETASVPHLESLKPTKEFRGGRDR
jgi:hypothetical protein